MYKSIGIISLAAVALVGCGEKGADTETNPTGPTAVAPDPGTSGSGAPAPESPAVAGSASPGSETGSTGSVPDAPPAGSSASTAGSEPLPDKELTPKEESHSMPQSGQANDYSTPERSEAMGTGSK